MTHAANGPEILWLVRHGQSAGNVARDAAEAADLPVVEVNVPDAQVPLSPLGARQAVALGHWFGAMPRREQPTVVLTSPYERAVSTARIALETAGLGLGRVPLVVDARLREKEFGLFEGLTYRGVRERHPEHAEMRARLGKFYHRAPGGESWCDVILRVHAARDALTREYAGERVLVVCHQVVVLCFRYLLEQLTEAELLEIDRCCHVANCSVTSYERDARGVLTPVLANFTAPLEAAGERVTYAPEGPGIAR